MSSCDCSCTANKKDFTLHSPDRFILGTNCEWIWVNRSRVEVAVMAVAKGVAGVYVNLSLGALPICSELTLSLF